MFPDERWSEEHERRPVDLVLDDLVVEPGDADDGHRLGLRAVWIIEVLLELRFGDDAPSEVLTHFVVVGICRDPVHDELIVAGRVGEPARNDDHAVLVEVAAVDAAERFGVVPGVGLTLCIERCGVEALIARCLADTRQAGEPLAHRGTTERRGVERDIGGLRRVQIPGIRGHGAASASYRGQ